MGNLKNILLSFILFIYLCSFTHHRYKYTIRVNANNELLVDGKRIELNQLYGALITYYSTNKNNDLDNVNAQYFTYTLNQCKFMVEKYKKSLNQIDQSNKAEYIIAKSNLKNWQNRQIVCENMPNKSFRSIGEYDNIFLKFKAQSSYKTYIAILDEINKVIYKIKNDYALVLFNGSSYNYLLDHKNDEEVRRRLLILRTLVPIKIIELPIKN